MAELAGFECVFLPRDPWRSRVGLLAEYASLYRQTLALLQSRRPGVLWLQLPPMPLLWAALHYRRRHAPQLRLVADCHNAVFNPRWARLPFGLSQLAQCDRVVVHNDVVTAIARAHGVPPHLLFELEDVPPLPGRGSAPLPESLQGRPRPWILIPGSLSADEPVAEAMHAARLRPQWTFVFTGHRSKAQRHGHDLTRVPANVVLPGYLETPVFDALLAASDVVLALTKADGVQLSVCNEALGFGKALVVSDTTLLRRLFAAGALMVDSNDPAALAAGIEQALTRKDELQRGAVKLAEERRRAWVHRYHELAEALASSSTRS